MGHIHPPVESAALFTTELGSNVDVGISPVHVNVSVLVIILVLEYKVGFYPPPVESSELLTIILSINEGEGVYG